MIFQERHLQVVWGLGLFHPGRLRTEDGCRVRVDDPGIPNRSAGPDFQDARLWIGSVPVRGDVELHLRSDGWRKHGHDETGSYSSVVLHVALERGFRGGPSSIPELILAPALLKSRVELVEDLERYRRPGPSVRLPDFEKLGEIRFQKKVSRLAPLRGRLSPAQIFYRAVLVGLGYRSNQAAFEELARLVPVDTLPEKNRTGIEALLRERASLLSWRTSGLRPRNHPSRRISGLARWLASVPLSHPQEPHLEDPLGASFNPTGEGFIGKDRGRILRNNIVLPFAVAFGTPVQSERAFELFRSLPSGPPNRRVKDAGCFYGVGPPRTLLTEWGLMEGFERGRF